MSSNPLLELLCEPWAITPNKLREMQAIYAAHFSGEKIDLADVEARLGRPLANDQQAYSIRQGGIAVLSIEGVLAPKANMFTRISGGASAQMLLTQVESAVADPRVKGLVLAIDSPGGSIFGNPELANAVFDLAAEKPIVSVSDGVMASAAYWIGSAANAAYITGPTVHVGSIGVVATHEFTPRGDKVQITEITAGRYKRIATDTAPLSDEGKAYLQQRVDHIYSVFVDAVVKHRGVSLEQVLTEMADGQVFVGQQAIDAGLVDGYATVDAIAEQMASDPSAFAKRRATRRQRSGTSASAELNVQPAGGAMPITREQLAAEAPDLLAAVLAEGQAAGASAERDRITSVRAQSMPGHEALVEQLSMDGKTTGAEAAMAVIAADKAQAGKRRDDMAADAVKPLPHDASATGDNDTKAPPAKKAGGMREAKDLSDAISKKQAEAKATGRNLSAVEALALVKAEQAA